MAPPPDEAASAPRPTDGGPSRGKILVVDDHEDTREIVRRTLELAGYTVAVACDGKQALDQILDHASPDLIVLDLLMPVMGGTEFIEILGCYQRLAAIPLIILSGMPPSVFHGHRTRFLRKPFEISELERYVDELVNRRAP